MGCRRSWALSGCRGREEAHELVADECCGLFGGPLTAIHAQDVKAGLDQPFGCLEPIWRPPDSGPAWDQTTWSGAVGQCPDLSVRSSTGPLGEDRPARCTWMLPAPLTPGMVNLGAPVVAGTGPATALPPHTWEVPAS